ncbi:MAG: GNAT family N-acetyltransferase [Acidobacteriota bacterium]
MPAESSFRFERLCDDHWPALQDLFLKVFHKQVNIKYLRRKYDTSYTGVKHLTYLAFDDERPIAFYGALPQSFSFGGETFLGVHTCDSITLPEYQRRGLHGTLAKKAYALMRDHGVRFVYAFHSDATLRACAPLGWQTHHRMQAHRIPTGMPPLATAFHRTPLLGRLHDRLGRRVLQGRASAPGTFENSGATSGAMSVRYSAEFFAYKKFTANAIVDFGGCRAWVRSGPGLWVGDLHFEDCKALDHGIVSLNKLARRLGCGHILFQTSPGTALNSELRSRYQGIDSWIVGWLPFVDDLSTDSWQTNFGGLDTF